MTWFAHVAKVQVSAKLLDVSGMESKARTQKQLCLWLCLRNRLALHPPAAGPPAAIAATGSAMILIFKNYILLPFQKSA